MASKIERITGRVLAIVAVVGLFSLQACVHPHGRFWHMPPGHVKHSMKHHHKHAQKTKRQGAKRVIRAVPRPPRPRR